MDNKFNTRQSAHNAHLGMIGNKANFDANTYNQLSNLLTAINAQLTPAFRLYPNYPNNLILNIGSNVITNSETSVRHSNPPINKQFPSFTSGTITLPASSGGSITVSPTITPAPTLTLTSGFYIKALIECDSLGNLSVTLGTEGASESAATFPGINTKAYQIGYIVIHNTAGVIDNVSDSAIVQFMGGGGSGAGGSGDGVKEPMAGYQWLEEDTFDNLESSSDSKVDSTYTNATQDLAKELYKILCDKSKTVNTSSGTSLTINSAPSFTVVAGDIVYITSGARIDQWRRIDSVISQTSFTLDAAFSGGDASNGDTLMVSQAVWTKDLVNYGSAVEKTRARDFFSGNILSIGLDYVDSLTLNDDVGDFVDVARVVASASNEGLVAATGIPTSDKFGGIYTRPQAPNQINDYTLSTNANQERLHLVFFANPSNGSVTSTCNLLSYECSFYPETFVDNGGALESAYCYSDGSNTEVNCYAPTLSSGKTRVQLMFGYIPNINSGRTKGQLSVFVDGLEIPRYIAGSTSDAYYKEIINPSTGIYDIIEFHTDLSISPVSIEVIKSEGVIDTANVNSLKLNTIYNAVVGSTAQVTSGVATHSSLQTAINDVASTGYILMLRGISITENITLNKELTIEGQGHSSNINGTLTLQSGSDYSMINKLRFNGNITLDAGSTGNYVVECWQGNGFSITDNGTSNVYRIIQE